MLRTLLFTRSFVQNTGEAFLGLVEFERQSELNLIEVNTINRSLAGVVKT